MNIMRTVSVTTWKSSGRKTTHENIPQSLFLEKHSDKPIASGEYHQPFANTLVTWYQCSDRTACYEFRVYQDK